MEIPSIPSEVPLEMRILAPDLTKSGLAIYGIEKGKNLESLCAEGIITKELLEKFGFIIVYDYDPGIALEPDEMDISANRATQLFHKDEIVNCEVVTFRYTSVFYERNGYTAIAFPDDIAAIVAKHLFSTKASDLHWVVQDLRSALQKTTIEQLLDKIHPGTDGRTWKELCFEVDSITAKEISSLHKALRSKIYPYLSAPNTLLVLDNKNMVHAGVRTKYKKRSLINNSTTILLWRGLMWSNDGCQIKSIHVS